MFLYGRVAYILSPYRTTKWNRQKEDGEEKTNRGLDAFLILI
jgi:uncharacterized protein YhjY with autotransporter beta-barrel domain